MEMFEKYGVNKTNISDITYKVGIAKGSFYNFFASKGDLLMEIYSEERQKVQLKAVKLFQNSDEDIDILIKKHTSFLMDAKKKRPILNLIYDNDALTMITDRSVRTRLLAYNDLINDQMTEMIQEWMDRRGHYNVDARIVTSMLRSISFLQFHDFAIGEDVYNQTVNAIVDAISMYVKYSQKEE
ncbi:MAG: TetR/AcrR family transcriptional regulator [Lachnospiraceae bacterium]|nr:TetR/AcrR family transcriptional regulator [Lachnospiraceae bacterium]